MKRPRTALLLLTGLALVLLATPSCTPKPQEEQESLLREKDREFVLETTAGMTQEVALILFTAEKDCEYCGLTEGFLRDVVSLSPLLSLEVLSLERDGARAAELGIDKAPGIAVIGKADFGLRYFGLPTGYEFTTLVETLRKAADGVSGLRAETVGALAALAHPVTITVFSTKS